MKGMVWRSHLYAHSRQHMKQRGTDNSKWAIDGKDVTNFQYIQSKPHLLHGILQHNTAWHIAVSSDALNMF